MDGMYCANIHNSQRYCPINVFFFKVQHSLRMHYDIWIPVEFLDFERAGVILAGLKRDILWVDVPHVKLIIKFIHPSIHKVSLPFKTENNNKSVKMIKIGEFYKARLSWPMDQDKWGPVIWTHSSFTDSTSFGLTYPICRPPTIEKEIC